MGYKELKTVRRGLCAWRSRGQGRCGGKAGRGNDFVKAVAGRLDDITDDRGPLRCLFAQFGGLFLGGFVEHDGERYTAD